ncbi:MAG TPA: class I SAM-dependent methyltransferase [Candidatus Binatia bacterium]|nr:class I SAM-dependent methyltransferase [Candidatus Binatia bacterium]
MHDERGATDGGTPAGCLVCAGTRRRPRFRKGGRAFVACAGCGFTRVEPLPSPEELERHYAWTYEQGPYAVFAAADHVRTLVARARLAALRPLLGTGPILDVGASTGSFVAAARAAGVAAEGIERSERAVALARLHDLPVRLARLEDFAPAAPYAAVTAFDVIEHLLDPGVLLARARAWLAPGGTLALTLPDGRSAAARLLGRAWWFYAPDDHFHYFDRRTIVVFLARHGFRVAHATSWRKPLPLAYVLAAGAAFYPRLARAVAPVAGLARRLGDPALRLPVGEMLVVAHPA